MCGIFVSGFIIPGFGTCVKGAISSFTVTDCSLNLPQAHFRNVADSPTERIHSVRRVKACDVIKPFRGNQQVGVIPETGQDGIGNTRLQKGQKLLSQGVLIHPVEATVGGHDCEVGKIVRDVVLRRVAAGGHDGVNKVAVIVQLSETSLQRVGDIICIGRLCLPQPEIVLAMRVRDVEHIPQAGIGASRLKQSNTGCPTVDPSAEGLVPQFQFGTGCRARLLRVDQQLILETILILECGCTEKAAPPLGRFGERAERVGVELLDIVVLTGHYRASPAFVFDGGAGVGKSHPYTAAHTGPSLSVTRSMSSCVALPAIILSSSSSRCSSVVPGLNLR